MSDIVIRYVITYLNRDGMRTLVYPAQGRYTYADKYDAQRHLNEIIVNNSADRLYEVYGNTNPKFEVRPCECWPRHFDPKGIWFD